jgi:type I restriction enzyme, S subunit
MIPAGTTIISARGTVGNLAMAAADMAFNQSCYALRCTDETGDSFVYLAAQHMVANLQAMAHGSVFYTITRQTFQAVSLAMPSPETLSAFEDQVSPFFQRIRANVVESRTLAQTRELLLPKLMSGEIRLKDAEKAVEDVA